MRSELEILQDVKQTFGWPVDTFRYGFMGDKRFWNGTTYIAELPEDAKEKTQESLKKIAVAVQELRFLEKIPWVRMIFLTGSVASLNARKHDDIDVWLVVDDRRIWLTRAIDFFIYFLRGKRRLSVDGVVANRVSDKFCFNFYSTMSALKLPRQSISYGMQFVDAIPIFIRNLSEYVALLERNEWIKDYFPHWYQRMVTDCRVESFQKTQNVSKRNLLLDALEYLAGVLMLLKAEKSLWIKPRHVFRSRFTTWGTHRILSRYDQEIIAEGSQED